MPTTLNNSGVVFPDTTTQTTRAIVSTSTVLTATAGLSAGGIGTYAMLGRGGLDIGFNGTAAGSGLYPSGNRPGSTSTPSDNNGSADDCATNSPQAGTWRCMGKLRNSGWSQTLWLRIS